MKVISPLTAITSILAIIALALPLYAQGILLPERPIHPGPQFPAQPFYVKNLRVSAVIHDAVAETTVEQTFVNGASVAQEGTYLYPLPEGATPTAFSMTVGDRTIEPRILPKDEAHAIYESYVRRYRDPALLEYVGRGLVKISVYPIPPQGERLITMRYTELLKPEAGVRRYSYSLSTSRFGARPVGATTVSIKLIAATPIKNIYSPSHQMSIRRIDDHNATASWEGANDTSDQDLTLFFSTSADDVGLSVLTYRNGEKDGYFMLLAAPRITIPAERILPKQVVFLLDRTGSMSGKKIEQARKSLLFCLDNLRPQDQFDVITFNESPDVLSRRMMPANQENVAKAKRFVADIEASGGTNIDEALQSALTLLRTADGSERILVFLTDGLPTVGETNINTILNHVRATDELSKGAGQPGAVHAALRKLPSAPSARIFCFGLGYDVNVPFLDRLAALGSGDSDYVKPEQDVESRVASFFSKVTSPILQNVQLAFNGADVYDVYPHRLPDLFKGSQLVVTGRFRGDSLGAIQLTGTSSGSAERYHLETKSGAADGENTFLPRIWAARKLGYLIDQVRLSESPAGEKEVIDEIVRLSQQYGIITEYTSFLVDEQQLHALGVNGPAPRGGSAVFQSGAQDSIRSEVARRAGQFGISGEGVTDQSGRARDLRDADQTFSRYQTANGSVQQNSYSLYSGALSASGAAAGNGGSGTPFGGSPADRQSTQSRGNFAGAQPKGGRSAGDNRITVQDVGDRAFYLQSNGVWQDRSYVLGKQRLVKVKAFSDAQFALLRANPSLGAYSSVGDTVIIRIGANAVEFGPDGAETLTAAEVKELSGK